MDNDSYTTSPSSYAEDEDVDLNPTDNEEIRHSSRTATHCGAAAAAGATHHPDASTQRLPPLPYDAPNPQRPRGPPPNMDSQDPPPLNTCHNDFREAPTTLTHSVTECREHYLQQIDPIFGTFGEFNLPPPNALLRLLRSTRMETKPPTHLPRTPSRRKHRLLQLLPLAPFLLSFTDYMSQTRPSQHTNPRSNSHYHQRRQKTTGLSICISRQSSQSRQACQTSLG